MTRARDIADLVDANGDIVADALDNVPAADVVNDTTPQLGGNLDLNSNNITGTGDIPAANLTGTLPAIDGSALTGISLPTPGRILETFGGVCNGQQITVSSGTYTLGNVVGRQNLTTSYADVGGSSIAYTPPTGTKSVIYEYHTVQGRGDSGSMAHWKTFVDDVEVLYARTTLGSESNYGVHSYLKWIFDCDASSADTNVGSFTSWTTSKTIKLQAREFSSTTEVSLHYNYFWDGLTNQNVLHSPRIQITAIG